MADISRKYNFTAGSTIQSGQMNEELNQLVDAVNDRYSKSDSDARYIKKLTTNWVNCIYSSGWTTDSGASTPLAASLGDDGIVYIRGAVKGGTTSMNTIVGTLPSGYAPAKNLVFLAFQASGVIIVMTITTSGAIVLSTNSANSTDTLYINTSFRRG
jgi:hypothetical protein